MKEYCYSWDNEEYSGTYKTEREAIIDARAERPDVETAYIGECEELDLRWDSHAEEIIESMVDYLTEDAGDAAENFEVGRSVEIDLEKMIDATVEAWISKHNVRSGCYAVTASHLVVLRPVGS